MKYTRFVVVLHWTSLKSEEEEEGHHQTEETHSFRQSESKNSVGEQLLLQAGVPETSELLRTYSQHLNTLYFSWSFLGNHVIITVGAKSSHHDVMNSCKEYWLDYLAYPMMRDPKTDPIPAPDPATPTVAAPAPMNLAALSISLLVWEVWRHLTAETEGWASLIMLTLEAATRAMADMVES